MERSETKKVSKFFKKVKLLSIYIVYRYMLILDLETIPLNAEDLQNYRKYLKDGQTVLLDALEKTIADRKKYKSDIDWLLEIESINEKICKCASLNPLMGRIACIGIIHKDKKARVEKTFFDRESEKNLLESFWNYISEKQIAMKTVTFNGLTFDLPFLYFRSMLHGLDISWHDMGLKKFSSFPHFDLMHQLAFWGSFKFASLDYFAQAFGYDVDPASCDTGSIVSKWWGCRQDSKLQEYNLEDCRKTAFLYNKTYKYYPQAPKP